MALSIYDLLYAILSMDAYNQGGGASQPNDPIFPVVAVDGDWEVAGFSATAYIINGKAVISYRGTDTGSIWDFLNDSWNGYGVGAGSPEGKQAELAVKFYQAVRDLGYSDIVLTGHSLGGGLAGMVASLYGEEAVVFDNMAFKDAAANAFEYVTTGEKVLVSIDPYGNEQYEYIINETLRDFLYPYGPPAQVDESKIKAIDVEGEFLHINRGGQTVPLERITLGEDVNLNGLDRHSISLLTVLLHAQSRNQQDWRVVEKHVVESLFEDVSAMAAGIQASNGSSASTVALQMLAYSAAEDGTKPFGDAAANAWFQDVNTYGNAVSAGLSTFDADAGASHLQDRLNAEIANAITQYAGVIAKNQITGSDWTGVLAFDETQQTLTVDYSENAWNALGEEPLEDFDGDAFLSIISNFAGADFWTYLQEWSGDALGGNIEQYIFGTGFGGTWTLADSSKDVAFFGSAGEDQVFGSAGNDLIFTGSLGTAGSTVKDGAYGMSGNDFLIGGDGQDLLVGGLGEDFVLGGAEADLISGGTVSNQFSIAIANNQDTSALDLVDDGHQDRLDGGAGDDIYFVYHSGHVDYSINWMASNPGANPYQYFDVITGYGGAYPAHPSNSVIFANLESARFDTVDRIRDPDRNGTILLDTWQLNETGIEFERISYQGNDIYLGQNPTNFDQNLVCFLRDGDLYGLSQYTWSEGGAGIAAYWSGFIANFIIEDFETGDFNFNIPAPAQGTDGDDTPDLEPQEPGQTGADYSGGKGNDVLIGTHDPDTLRGDADSDTVSGEGGNDDVSGGDGDDTVSGGDGDDTVSGGDGSDTLSGDAGNDTVYGGDGADTISGGAGADVLFGQGGSDTISGGTGSDTYVFEVGDGADTISDEGVSLDQDTVKLTGLKETDVTLRKTGEGLKDLLVTLVATGETILVLDQFAEQSSGTDRRIEQILFTDSQAPGTPASAVWTASEIEAKATAGTPANTAPGTTNPIGTQSSTEDEAWSFTVPANTFTDADGDALTFSASQADGSALPAWLSFDAATQTFSGTPPQDFNGTVPLKVIASDGQAAADSTFNLVIDPVNDAPVVITGLTAQSSAEDAAWSFTVPANTFTDADGEALTFSATQADNSALPAWLSFDAATQTFSGTPPQDFNGTLSLKVTASDGTASVDSTFNLVIDPVNDAPVVGSEIADQSGTEGTLFSFAVPANTFSDVDGDQLTLSATLADGSALPAWLTFDPATQTFSGTPPQGAAGALSVTVSASDGTLSAEDSFTLTVAAGASVITGTNSDETLTGTAGDDQIFGLDGNDYLVGGEGADQLDGGNDWDIAAYWDATTGVTVNLADASANTGEAAGDTYTGIEAVVGSGHNDTMTGDGYVNGLYGGTGDDTLNGAGGSDYVFGEGGNDTFLYETGGGHDTFGDFTAGAGTEDVIRFDGYFTSFAGVVAAARQSGSDTVIDIDANNSITLQNVTMANLHQDDFSFASVPGSVITGTSSGETLEGTVGDDQLYGLAGVDYLVGGVGADLLDGGEDWDIAAYWDATSAVTVNLADASANTGEAAGDTYTDIEAVIGSGHNDTITGDSFVNGLYGGTGDDTLNGGGGSDYVFGEGGNDTFLYETGGGHDTFGDFTAGVGTEDVIRFDGYFTSFAGVVAAARQSGSDTVIDIDANNSITLQNVTLANLHQDDFAFASSPGAVITGTSADETLEGTAGDDQISGLDGNDYLVGGLGADQLDGGNDWDVAAYWDATSGVTVNLTDAGQNTGEASGDTYAGIEAVVGSGHNDTLVGDGFVNGLYGSNGDDTLNGAGGNDYVFGEGGNDTFIFAAGGDHDTFGDFTAGAGSVDVIRFEGLFGNFTAVMAAARQSGSDTVIDIDANTSITLQNVVMTGLHQDDFQFV